MIPRAKNAHISQATMPSACSSSVVPSATLTSSWIYLSITDSLIVCVGLGVGLDFGLGVGFFFLEVLPNKPFQIALPNAPSFFPP